ncbi:MAG TPA: squalene--hopene cyclase [Gammaproteobacteria bacterium]|nr:squalene--hopene cyclase [Gammaproteobacteria bacterium]
MIIKPRFGRTEPQSKGRAVRPEIAARDHDLHAEVEAAVRRARSALLAQQHADGHWVYELEADCTIPAEYVLMNHFMNEVDEVLERKIAHYLRDRQAEHGGWPLYHGGDFDLSCSVKAYYALKLAGDDPNDAHMIRARTAILAHGGAERCNVFTRIALALFEQVPWRAVPFIPAEVILLPRWFPFHISRVSYWSRTVMVPLFILCTLRPKAANPRGVDIRELFVTPPEEIEDYFRPKNRLAKFFLALDNFGRWLERFVPRFLRQRAIRRAEHWFIERLNGTDGLGGIFPAMVNSYEALAILGYPADHPHRVQVRTALRKLLVTHQHGVYCQPCMSPVWDTGLAAHALFEAAGEQADEAVHKGLEWLRDKQLGDEPGDWRENKPGLRGGGWAFQYNNSYYPDLDDTSMVAWIMYRADPQHYWDAIERAADWTCGMQSKNGGFASFDADNTHYYLNAIPFADHGALLDPPTEDVTARCIALLSLVNKFEYRVPVRRAIEYMKRTQEPDGPWYGRWGTNYIYGTWSALSALELAGEDVNQPYIQRAVKWLESMQNPDGGWGESNDSYYPPKHRRPHPSTPFQTAWALLGLISAGCADTPAVRRGIRYLLEQQLVAGLWDDPYYTAPGFPRVFYLKYHGYAKYFPLWALARYRNINQG